MSHASRQHGNLLHQLNQLKKSGERITPIRAALIEALDKTRKPATTQELLAALARRGLSANKTTVYRQLEVLLRYNIAAEIHFTDRAKRYELARVGGHHHHLVCLKCGRVEKIILPADLEPQEKKIRQKNQFKVLQHSLEFFGRCRYCQSQGKESRRGRK